MIAGDFTEIVQAGSQNARSDTEWVQCLAAELHAVALIGNGSVVTTISKIRGKEEKQMECPHCRNNSEKWMPLHPENEQNMIRTPKQALIGAHIECKVCANCGFIVRQISRNDLEKCNPGVGFPGG
jgi:hypothetical protein